MPEIRGVGSPSDLLVRTVVTATTACILIIVALELELDKYAHIFRNAKCLRRKTKAIRSDSTPQVGFFLTFYCPFNANL